MARIRKALIILSAALLFASIALTVQGEENEILRVSIRARPGEAEKFAPLAEYLKSHGLTVEFFGMPNDAASVHKIQSGEVDVMFAGSTLSTIMIMKDIAYPVARPLNKKGENGYHAIIVTMDPDMPEYDGTAGYFAGKRVVAAKNRTAGELYLVALVNADPSVKIKDRPSKFEKNPDAKEIELVNAKDHGSALSALKSDAADVAILNNQEFSLLASKYPGCRVVGEDSANNYPSDTVMASKKADPKLIERLKKALLALRDDNSPQAKILKDSKNVDQYAEATGDNFKSTMNLLDKLEIGKDFEY